MCSLILLEGLFYLTVIKQEISLLIWNLIVWERPGAVGSINSACSIMVGETRTPREHAHSAGPCLGSNPGLDSAAESVVSTMRLWGPVHRYLGIFCYMHLQVEEETRILTHKKVRFYPRFWCQTVCCILLFKGFWLASISGQILPPFALACSCPWWR